MAVQVLRGCVMSVYLLWTDALDPQLRFGNPHLVGVFATRKSALAAIPNSQTYHYFVTRRGVAA